MKKVLFILIAIIAISCQQNDTLVNLDGFYKVDGVCRRSFPSAALQIHQINDERFEMHELYDSVITCIVTSPTTFQIPLQKCERSYYIEGTGTVISPDTLYISYLKSGGNPDSCNLYIIKQ